VNLLQAAAVLVGSGILSWVVVTLSIRLAHRLEVFDHPDGGRKTQVRPIPNLGGVAVALAFTAVILAGVLITDRLGFVLGLGVLVPALAAAVIGFLDDRSHLNPYVRLVLQAGVGLLAWLMGTRIALSGNEVLDALLLILWIMVIINGTNLLDNSDGLAASTVLIMSVGAAIVAAVYGQALVSLMGVALVGVSIGYLWHNWFPAKVYMGDSGAYFLGTLVAIMAVRLKPEGVPPSIGVLIVVLLVLLPLVDTTYVVIKRLRRGVHPFTAGRDHLSHVLQGRGMSVPLSVVTLQCISMAGVASAVILAFAYR
jgi:UDP-GlcNAc:undecaprenyl-phosphate GlcNAc-1-phosphate transferase